MLRVVVESAKGLPKKKLGLPDPVASVIFKGESFTTNANDHPVKHLVFEKQVKCVFYSMRSLWSLD